VQASILIGVGGAGGSTPFGAGGAQTVNGGTGNGQTTTVYGAGGSGGSNAAAAGASSGGTGGAGLIIVDEYT